MATHAQTQRKRRGYRLTTPAVYNPPLKPAWIRIDRAPDYAGVSRSTIYEWLATGKIINKHIKLNPASQRTIRLINFESLCAFIEKLPAVEAAEVQANRATA